MNPETFGIIGYLGLALAAGTVVAEGTPEAVSRDPAAIAAYFGGPAP